MSTGWGWMTGWWGAGLAIVTLLLARLLHRVIGKICRPRDAKRSGAMEILSGKIDAKFEIIAVLGSIAETVAARLDDKDEDVRYAAFRDLGRRAALPDGVLTAVAAWLDSEHEGVQRAGLEPLNGRAALPDGVLTAVAAWLDSEHEGVQRAGLEPLNGRAALSDWVHTVVLARLDDKNEGIPATQS